MTDGVTGTVIKLGQAAEAWPDVRPPLQAMKPWTSCVLQHQSTPKPEKLKYPYAEIPKHIENRKAVYQAVKCQRDLFPEDRRPLEQKLMFPTIPEKRIVYKNMPPKQPGDPGEGDADQELHRQLPIRPKPKNPAEGDADQWRAQPHRRLPIRPQLGDPGEGDADQWRHRRLPIQPGEGHCSKTEYRIKFPEAHAQLMDLRRKYPQDAPVAKRPRELGRADEEPTRSRRRVAQSAGAQRASADDPGGGAELAPIAPVPQITVMAPQNHGSIDPDSFLHSWVARWHRRSLKASQPGIDWTSFCGTVVRDAEAAAIRLAQGTSRLGYVQSYVGGTNILCHRWCGDKYDHRNYDPDLDNYVHEEHDHQHWKMWERLCVLWVGWDIGPVETRCAVAVGDAVRCGRRPVGALRNRTFTGGGGMRANSLNLLYICVRPWDGRMFERI